MLNHMPWNLLYFSLKISWIAAIKNKEIYKGPEFKNTTTTPNNKKTLIQKRKNQEKKVKLKPTFNHIGD